MKFNFGLFKAIATRVYNSMDSPVYSLEEVLWVFRFYFQTYEDTFGESHPPIRKEQIARIIEAMPFINWEDGTADIYSSDYEALIEQHFQTRYHNCDYNINHFFSGDIRMLRYYETLY